MNTVDISAQGDLKTSKKYVGAKLTGDTVVVNDDSDNITNDPITTFTQSINSSNDNILLVLDVILGEPV